MAEPKEYEVFVVTCVGVRLEPIKATSHEEAVERAVENVDWDKLFPAFDVNRGGVVHVNGHWEGHHAALIKDSKTGEERLICQDRNGKTWR